MAIPANMQQTQDQTTLHFATLFWRTEKVPVSTTSASVLPGAWYAVINLLHNKPKIAYIMGLLRKNAPA